MIRYSLYNLSTRLPPPTTALATTVARPAAVVLAGKVNPAWFSTNRKRRDDDALEVRKKEHPKNEKNPQPQMKPSTSALERYFFDSPLSDYHGPLFRPMFRGFDDFFTRDPFAPLFSRHESPFMDIMPVLRDFPSIEKEMTLLRSSPGYEIREDAGKYEISVSIPDGIDADNLKVEVENDGSVLHLSGRQTTRDENDEVVSDMRFEKRFSIGANVDTDQITANLDEGVLVLKAPKLEPDTPQRQSIPITQKPHASLDEEVVQKSFSDEFDESDWAETGKVSHEKNAA
jgi:HSP20 family protein